MINTLSWNYSVSELISIHMSPAVALSLLSQATTLSSWTLMSFSAESAPPICTRASSTTNVHTFPQNRYVCNCPLILVLFFEVLSALHTLLSNSERTFIAIVGESIPLITISSKASVNDMPKVDLRYSSSYRYWSGYSLRTRGVYAPTSSPFQLNAWEANVGRNFCAGFLQ